MKTNFITVGFITFSATCCILKLTILIYELRFRIMKKYPSTGMPRFP